MNRVKLFHLCALRGAVNLEKHGMTRSRRQRPARSIACDELGLDKHTSHDDVIEALNKAIDVFKVSSDSTASGT